MNQTFNADAGFHLANVGTDRNVVLAERICASECNRIRLRNAPEIARLNRVADTLTQERRQLQLILGAALRTGLAPAAWPIWHLAMTIVFVSAGFAFARMSFEPFDFSPELMWPCCIALGFLCAYGTSEFLEKMDLKVVVLGVSIVLFLSSIAGLMALASVRGEIFIHQLQLLTATHDAAAIANQDSALAFYATTGPKMRLFLMLLSLSLELAAGLALHEVRLAFKARRLIPSPETRRLEAVEREIAETEAKLTFLRNEPAVFEHEYRRNLYIGLLDGASRHARSHMSWPTTLIVIALVAFGPQLRAQGVDLWEGLDLSATSQAANYDGSVAHAENIEAAARIVATLPAGSRVTVAGITDVSFSRPFVLLTGLLPATPGKLREYDQIAATRNRLAASIRRMGGSVQPRFQSTDILGFLILAGMAFHNTPTMRHVLVIHSDMRQSGAPIDLEHVQRVAVKDFLALVEDHQLISDLQGVEVFVYGAHAIGKDIGYWQSLRDFWTAYFARCHATLRTFSMMRDIPDLSQTR
jgi:hypothetical protein